MLREVTPTETRISIFGDENIYIIVNCSLQSLDKSFRDWMNGAYIQDAFSQLKAEEREFFQTGITPEKWAEIFPVKKS